MSAKYFSILRLRLQPMLVLLISRYGEHWQTFFFVYWVRLMSLAESFIELYFPCLLSAPPRGSANRRKSVFAEAYNPEDDDDEAPKVGGTYLARAVLLRLNAVGWRRAISPVSCGIISWTTYKLQRSTVPMQCAYIVLWIVQNRTGFNHTRQY